MEIQLSLDRSRRIPLSIQIAHGVRDALFSQRLSPGTKLPPTRELAQRLRVSRTVVVEAYEWLAAEGFSESRPGSGTYVSSYLNWSQQRTKPIKNPPQRTDPPLEQPVLVDFRPGLPAVDLFPRGAWRATAARALRNVRDEQLGYGPVEGLPQLRRLVAEYVARTRGLPVAPERVVITIGAAQAGDLMLRTLAPVHSMVVEDPCPEPILRLARLHQIQIVPIPVDRAGLRVDMIPSEPTVANIVHVIPSHQYPTGAAMQLQRRLELLNWAEKHNAIILEDDYDSEFRYDQAPPIALSALDSSGRTVYIGTFSKTMFPGLRLGFCVIPERFIERFLELKWFSDRCVPVLEQLALAEWLETGIFERHVRKMRRVYAGRRNALIQALTHHFGPVVDIHGVPAGMHVLVTFHLKLTESELITKALLAGIQIYPSSPCFTNPTGAYPHIILGFGHLDETTIQDGIAQLANSLQQSGSVQPVA